MRVESQCASMIYSYNYESREPVCFHDIVIIMRVESQCASMIYSYNYESREPVCFHDIQL